MPIEFELVLPCYNESKSLEKIIARAKASALKAGFTPESFQLVLVQNGSQDNSLSVLETLKSNSEYSGWFRYVQVPVNQGYGLGIQSGLHATQAPFIGWSHADQQCDPDDAFRALEKLKASQNPAKTLVKGVRIGRSVKELFVSRIFELIAWQKLGYRFYEINAQPKVFHRDLLSHCPNPPNDFAFDVYILFRALKNKYQLQTIRVNFPPRVHGFSNWANGIKNRSHHIKNMIRYMEWLGKTEGKI